MKKYKILITGANSFLGKRLVKRLNLGHYHLYPTTLHPDARSNIYKMDLLDINEVKKMIDKIQPDIIFHLAALVNLSRDYQIAYKCIDINIKGTLNLMEALINQRINSFYFSSTEEVYGNQSIPYTENQIPNPPSPYSITKIASEQLCQQYSSRLGFNLYIFRIATYYGPENPIDRLIPQIIINAIANKKILLNSGIKKRDYIYVDDVTRAFELALKIENKSESEIINLGGGYSYSLKQLVNLVISITKSKSKIIYNYYPDRIMEADQWLLDISKAKRILNWKPKIDLKTGLENTINYFKKLQ